MYTNPLQVQLVRPYQPSLSGFFSFSLKAYSALGTSDISPHTQLHGLPSHHHDAHVTLLSCICQIPKPGAPSLHAHAPNTSPPASCARAIHAHVCLPSYSAWMSHTLPPAFPDATTPSLIAFYPSRISSHLAWKKQRWRAICRWVRICPCFACAGGERLRDID